MIFAWLLVLVVLIFLEENATINLSILQNKNSMTMGDSKNEHRELNERFQFPIQTKTISDEKLTHQNAITDLRASSKIKEMSSNKIRVAAKSTFLRRKQPRKKRTVIHWKRSPDTTNSSARDNNYASAVANLALHKPTLQSSFYAGHGSEKAVDGSEEHCSFTAGTDAGWLVVDLQQQYNISKVVIVNRKDCCGELDHSAIPQFNFWT